MFKGKELTYTWKEIPLLKGINLHISSGELLMIVGPNGAGKSTLIKLLTDEIKDGVQDIDFKKKKLNQWKLQDLILHRAKFSQHHSIDIPFSVKEVVMMGRYPYFKHQPHKIDHTLVDRMIENFDLHHLAQSPYNILSGGEKQRAHLARTFVQLENEEQQKLLFLDEPLNNLDVKYQFKLMDFLKKWTQNGHSVLMVAHDLNLTAQYADNVLLMKKGAALAYGPMSQVIQAPILTEAYEIDCLVMQHPLTQKPMIAFGHKSL